MKLLLKRIICYALVVCQVFPPQMLYALQNVSIDDVHRRYFETDGNLSRLVGAVYLKDADADGKYALKLDQSLTKTAGEILFFSASDSKLLGSFTKNTDGYLLSWSGSPLSVELFATCDAPVVIGVAGNLTIRNNQNIDYGLALQAKNCFLENLNCTQLVVAGEKVSGNVTGQDIHFTSTNGMNTAQIMAKNSLFLEGVWHHAGKIKARDFNVSGAKFSAQPEAQISVERIFDVSTLEYSCDCPVQALIHRVNGHDAASLPKATFGANFDFSGSILEVTAHAINTDKNLKVTVDHLISLTAQDPLRIAGEYSVVEQNLAPILNPLGEFCGFSAQSPLDVNFSSRAKLELAHGKAQLKGDIVRVTGQMTRTGVDSLGLIIEAYHDTIVDSQSLLDDLSVKSGRQNILALPERLRTLHSSKGTLSLVDSKITPSEITRIDKLNIKKAARVEIHKQLVVSEETRVDAGELRLNADANFKGKTFIQTTLATQFGDIIKGVAVDIEDGVVLAGDNFTAYGSLDGKNLHISAKTKDIVNCPTLKILDTRGDLLTIGLLGGGPSAGKLDCLIAHEKSIWLGTSNIGTSRLLADECAVGPDVVFEQLNATAGSFVGNSFSAEIAKIKTTRDAVINGIQGDVLKVMAGGKFILRDATIEKSISGKGESVSISGATANTIDAKATDGDAFVGDSTANKKLTAIAAKTATIANSKSDVAVAKGENAVTLDSTATKKAYVLGTETAQAFNQKAQNLTVTGDNANVSGGETTNNLKVNGNASSNVHGHKGETINAHATKVTTISETTAKRADVKGNRVVGRSNTIDHLTLSGTGENSSITTQGTNKGDVTIHADAIGCDGDHTGSLKFNANSAVIRQNTHGDFDGSTKTFVLIGKTEGKNFKVSAHDNSAIIENPSSRNQEFTLGQTFDPKRLLSVDDSVYSIKLTQTSTKEMRFFGQALVKPNVTIDTKGDIEGRDFKVCFEQDLSITGNNLDFRGTDFSGEGKLSRTANGNADYSTSKTNVKGGVTDVTEGNAIYDRAVINSDGSVSLQTKTGDLVGEVLAIEAADIFLKSLMGNLKVSSKAKRHGSGENFCDVLEQARLCSRGILSIFGAQSVIFEGVHTESIIETLVSSLGNIYDLPVELVRQQVQHFKKGYSKDTWINQHVSDHVSKGKFHSYTAGYQDLYAPTYKVQEKITRGDAGVRFHPVYNTHLHESQTKKKGGLFGKSKTIQSSSQSQTARGAIIGSVKPAQFISDHGNITLEAIHSTAPRNIVHAVEGIVLLNQGVNTSSASSQTHTSDMFWQRSVSKQESHKTYTPIYAPGGFEIHANEAVVQQVAGQVCDFVDNIEMHGGKVSFETLHEYHEVIRKSQSGPTAALSAVVALAVSIATVGTGSPSVIMTMASAADGALYSAAALSLLNNGGNVSNAAKQLCSKDTLKSIGMAAATAGLTKGVGMKLGVPTNPSNFIGHVQYQALRAGVGAITSATFNGRVDFEQLAKGFAAGVVGGVAANEIGDLYSLNEQGEAGINFFVHKALHGLKGGLEGYIIDGKQGIAPGAIGAMVAETVADLVTSQQDMLKISQNEGEAALRERIEFTKNVARITTAISAAALGIEDINLALQTADSSLEHNYAAHCKDYLKDIGVMKEGDEIYEDDAPEKTDGQKQFERGRQKFIDSTLKEATQRRGSELDPATREKVIENADKVYVRAYGTAEAIRLATDPKIVLQAASYVPGPTGLVAGTFENAYDVAIGNKNIHDAMIDAALSAGGILKGAKVMSTAAKGAQKITKDGGKSVPSTTDSKPLLNLHELKSQNPTQAQFNPTAPHLHFKTPGQSANDNFLKGLNHQTSFKPAANSNQMPSTLKATGTTGGTTGASMQNLANTFGGGTKVSATPRTMETFASSRGLGNTAPTSGTKLGTIHETGPSAPTTKLAGDDLVPQVEKMLVGQNTRVKLFGTDKVAQIADPALQRIKLWTPYKAQGPLASDAASTFRSSTYTEVITKEPITLYRVYGGKAGELGKYWTRTSPSGALQSQIDGAILPRWGNSATKVTTIQVPPGQRLFVGAAAEQHGGLTNLIGGGSQYYINRVSPLWVVKQGEDYE